MFQPPFELMDFSRFVNDGEKLPLSVYYSAPQTETVFHQHEFVELVLVLSGTGVHNGGQRKISLRRGDILVLPRGFTHRYQQVSKDFSLINILFIPETLPISGLDAAQLPGFKPIMTGFSPDDKEDFLYFHVGDEKLFRTLEVLALALTEEHEAFSPGKNFVSLGIFMVLIGKLARCYSAEGRFPRFNYDFVSKVISYLNKNYREEISIAKLCRIGGMSKSSLMRNFKKATGGSPLQYQLGLRMGEAAVLLRCTEKPLWEIASEVGIGDINYLGRLFKRVQGLSPLAYRKKFREKS